MDAELVAISPQTRERNGEMKTKHGIDFSILSDPGNAYARELSLAHSLPEDLREVYRAFDIVLPDYNGDDSWQLPLPTRIVVDGGGTIRRIDSDPDYTSRPEPAETLEALRGLG